MKSSLIACVLIMSLTSAQFSFDLLSHYGMKVVQFLNSNIDDESCIGAIKAILLQLPNSPDAISMVLNSGKGLNDLGGMTNCQKNEFTHYVYMSAVSPVISMKQGLCLPIECNISDLDALKWPVANAINGLMVSIVPKNTSIHYFLSNSSITFIDPVEKYESIDFYPPMFYCAVLFNAFFIFLSVSGAIYWRNRKAINQTLWGKVFEIFNFKKNFISLFEVNAREEADLKVFDGVRVLSMSWVILGHVFWVLGKSPVQNPEVIIDFVQNPWYAFIYNASYSVDIFFFLSAFLICYITMKKLEQTKGKISILSTFAHRIMRLYPLMLVAYFLYNYLLPLLGSGPLYGEKFSEMKGVCDNEWHRVFLFYSNYSPLQVGCMNFTWYLSADMQFFVVSIPIIVLLYKREIVGIILNGLVLLVSWFTQLYLVNEYSLSYILLKYDDNFNKYYPRPLMRAPAYFMGIFLGYTFYMYKMRPTSIFHSLYIKLKENKGLCCFLQLLGFGGLVFILQFMCYMNKHYTDIDPTIDKLYYLFSRPVFITLLYIWMLPSIVGNAPYMQMLLGNTFFNITAKLSYCGYLIHLAFMFTFTYSSEHGIYFEVRPLLLLFWGYWVITMLVSIFINVVYDAPVAIMCKNIFSSIPKTKQEVKDDELKEMKTESTEPKVLEHKINI